jgi:hypothetical protein
VISKEQALATLSESLKLIREGKPEFVVGPLAAVIRYFPDDTNVLSAWSVALSI